MTNVVIVVRKGFVESVYTRNKNIQVEMLDLDVQDDEEKLERRKRRLKEIENNKTYKDALWL